MKKQKGTISILESIRNKLNKIEKNNTPKVDDHDDFEYIDNSSKEIISSKQNAKIATAAANHQEPSQLSQNIDDDFDFLSSADDGEAVENKFPTITIDPPVQNAEIVKPTPQETPKVAQEMAPQQPIEPIYQAPKAIESAIPKDDLDLDLDLNFEAEPKETVTLEIGSQPESTTPKVEEKINLENHDQPKTAGETTENYLNEELDLDEEVEEKTDDAHNEDGAEDEDLDDDLEDLNEDNIEEGEDENLENEDLDEVEDENEEENDDNLEDEDLDEVEDENEEENDDNLENDDLDDLDDLEDIEDLDDLEDEDLDEHKDSNKNEGQIKTEDVIPTRQSINNVTNSINERTSIISETAAKKATDSIKDLMQAIPKKQHFLQTPSPAFKSGETIEDMISEMLAPKLEQWMEENLPMMVERVVRDEIKKLIPKDE